ncbi:MAG: tRNA (adenosine(37)-N6)-threonylcarbamoyltransferase complex dimerization subunit type 1 TsaB [Mangrovibacterium sp.]
MAYLLNLESSTEVCSVSLAKDEALVDLLENTEGRNHARLMSVFVQEIMQRNRLDFKQLGGIAVSKGPGSYTGLRIGVSLAKGLCYANRLPLIAVSPLQSMASQVLSGDYKLPEAESLLLCPTIDARRMEVYMALYDRRNREVEAVSARVIDKHSFDSLLERGPLVFFGNGSEKLRPVISHAKAVFIANIKTSAQFMCSLSYRAFTNKQFADLAYFEPFYLKDFIAGVTKKQI